MQKASPKLLALVAIAIVLLAAVRPVAGYASSTDALTPQKLLISELQTGGYSGQIENGRQEFIELYNPGGQHLDVSGWQVEYLTANHTGTGSPTRILAVLEGVVAPHGHVLLSFVDFLASADYFFGTESSTASGFLAKSGGHVRVIDNLGVTIDLIAWGTGVAIGEWPKVAEVPVGMSIQRIVPSEETGTSGKVFYEPTVLTTPIGGGIHLPDITLPVACSELVITEVLPNPSGADAGREFIEIHNPTERSISLKGCTLRLGDDGKTYRLPDDELAANAYRALMDTETGIILPNATSQEVWLFSETSEQAVTYPDGMADDLSWALLGGDWLSTSQPTPGEVNVLPPEPPLDEGSEPVTDDKVLPVQSLCPAGKERNPATNRCRNIIVAVQETACQPGYTRNETTNRCRKAETSKSPAACRAGQERNYLTGRCRAVLAAQTAPLPCPAGQERHSDTNRCRKKQDQQASSIQVQDVRTAAPGTDARVWLVAFLIVGVTGYGIYEWRHEIRQIVSKYIRVVIGKGRGG